MLSFERHWNALSVVLASRSPSSLVEGMPVIRVNEIHSIENDLCSFLPRPFGWVLSPCRSGGHLPPGPLGGAEQWVSFSHSLGWPMLLKDDDAKWFTFLSSKSWFLKLRCDLLAYSGTILRKDQICVDSEKEEAVHWAEYKCSHNRFPSK